MPITELTSAHRPRVIGRLRLGLKPKGQSYPVATDYFVFDCDDPRLQHAFLTQYGPQPKEVDITLTEDVLLYHADGTLDLDRSTEATIERIFPQWRRYWKANRLFCQGDSHTARRLRDDGRYDEIGCNDQCPHWRRPDGKVQCRYEGNLTFLLWKLPTLDSFQVTARERSIRQINAYLRTLLNLRGHAAKVPLKMGLEPYKTHKGTTAHAVFLRLDPQVEAGGAPALESSLALPPAAPDPDPGPGALPEATPVPGEPPAVDAVDEFVRCWEAGPSEDLAADPQEATQIRRLIGRIRTEVIDRIDRPAEQVEVALICMGRSTRRTRTAETLQRIIAHYGETP